MANFLPNPHTSYNPYGQRIAPADISREDANALTLANRQADPSKFRGFIFDTLMRMGADPGQASLFGAPASFMPVLGDMQDIEDVGYAASQGDYMGAALGGALAAVPFLPARGVMKHARKAPEPQGIKAYHGSPHDFDKFSMDAIGTGEGAQAYGHGLYFAENEDVARSYRDALQDNNFNDHARFAEAMYEALDPLPSGEVLFDGGLYTKDDLAKKARSIMNGPNWGRLPAKLRTKIEDNMRGTMYEVNINANPDDFLDWDAPLSEQPQSVREALSGFPEDMMGGDAVRSHTQFIGDKAKRDNDILKDFPGAWAQNSAEELRGAGIPGVKYLDGASRGAGEGSRNYVVFDDSLVSIVKKYGIAGAISMGIISQQQGEEMQAQGLI